MAGTVRKNIGLAVTNDSGDNRYLSETADIAQTGSGVDDRNHKIGSATHEALSFPAIVTKGTIGYKNISDVVIDIGLEVSGVFYPFASPGPGDIGVFTGAVASYFAKAASGTDKELRLFVVEA